MSNLLANYSFFEYILLTLLSILCGLSIRYSLSIAKQLWALTYHHTLTFCLLPVITMIVTTLIAGNLALSLGMIGALSIVRFRNPVKSPLELVIFFALITIGIGTSVNFKLSILITIIINVVIIVFYRLELYFKKKGKNIFSISFNEGSSINLVEIKSKNKIEILEKNENLEQFAFSENPITFYYRISFLEKKQVDDLKKALENNKDIINIDINYVR